MAKAAAAPKKAIQKRDAYKAEGDRLTRTKPVCPKCGPGVFMAVHKDRVSCGRCGHTEYNDEKKGRGAPGGARRGRPPAPPRISQSVLTQHPGPVV